MRKANLSQLPARRVDGIHLAPFERARSARIYFVTLPEGLEGLVSKHRDSFYRAGRFDRWVKVKNRSHPAFSRVMDQV